MEIVVDPHTGRWYTVGDTGAEFRDIPRGAIVFNHTQSKSLLENGYVAGRASALVGGTAMVTGGISVSGAQASTVSGGHSAGNYKSPYSGASNSTSSSSTDSELEKMDWIEIALNRIQSAIERVKNIASSAYKSISSKLSATADEIDLVTKEIGLQEAAYARYMKEANSVGLSSDLAALVQNGAIDISQYSEDTQKLIKDYQDFYEKAIECSDAVADLKENLAELYESKFNDIKDDFDSRLELLEHMSAAYETGIDKLEAQGYLQSTEYYAALQDVERKNISLLNAELESLHKSFSEAMSSGEIEEGSEAYYSMASSINEVKEALDDAELSLAEYAQTMREIEWDHFNFIQDRISQLTSESDFLIDLMGNSDMHDDNGQLTDNGMATMGLHGQNYNTYMAQADAYAKELLKIDQQLAEDPYNTDLLERREELLGLQQDSILAAEDEKQAIIELVREGIDIQLDAMRELIDSYTEALDEAKDLYDYQKKIKSQTDKIASIEKQLSAYSGFDDEETRAKVQKLTVELTSAKEDLEESQYDRYVSDQKKLLNSLYDEYELVLNQRLDNSEALLSEMIGTVNANADSINSTLVSATDSVGYTMSANMQSIWNGSVQAIDGVITLYGDGFNERLTTTNSVLAQIEVNTAAMVEASNAAADDKVSGTAAVTKPDVVEKAPSHTITITTASSSSNSGSLKKTSSSGGSGYSSTSSYGGSSGSSSTSNKPVNKSNLTRNDDLLKKKPTHYQKYASGGLADYTGVAWIDGSPTKPELVLDAQDTANFIALKDTLRKMTAQELTFGTSYGADYAQRFSGITDISKKVASLRDTSGVNTGVNVGDTQINIQIDHVEDYNDFVSQLQRDKRFEGFIQSITVDRLAGNSPLKKYKYF